MLCRRHYITGLLVILVLVGCSGSGSIAQPSPSPASESPLRVAGSAKALALVQKLAQAYENAYPGVTFKFDSGIDSIPSIREVGAGTLDLGLSSRDLPETEAGAPVVVRRFASDAVVFAANASAALPGLSSEQIREVYGGRVTTWEQLGAVAGPIIVLDREESDSAHQVLLKVLDGTPIQARTVVHYKSKDMLDALETTPGTLGYANLALIRLRQSPSIRVLALDGVSPTPETVVDGTYPWQQPFYLVYHRNPSPSVHRFLDFIRGPEGRGVLEGAGYAAVTN
ncbi:MAG: substrate-binding domain-containing protein [Chloroflexi bacterium]|nr:substrate-binding domain-containing protein [Chloroflexota bacterium]